MTNYAKRIMELFAGNESQHGTHGEPHLDENGLKWAIKKTARTLKKQVTVEMWEQHLAGKRPLGIVPISNESMCKWGSIDIDQYDIDLIEVVRRVEDAELPFVPCRSKSGGLHLFMFFAEWTEAAAVQTLLRDLAASLGFAGTEIFPKQTKILVEQGDQGNWMVMPYFGGDFGGKLKMQHGLKKTGADMTLVEFLAIAEKRKVTQDQMIEIAKPIQVKAAEKKKGTKGNGNKTEPKVPYGDGPPCLQHLATIGIENNRNNALFHIGVYLKKAWPAEWKQRLEADNQLYMKPPLPSDEVNEVIKSLTKKEYEYKCKDQPMQSYCNSTACRARKHGVGIGGAYPEILELSKLASDPPVWFVSIPGGHRLIMSTEDLQNYRRFHKMCMSQANVCYKPISEPVWYSIIGDAMQQVNVIEASQDLNVSGVFLELLETFLTNRMRGKTKEDLLRGAPWEDEAAGRHYFQLAPLEKFLMREGFKSDGLAMRPMIMHRISELGGDNRQMNIKGRNRFVWWVPSKAIEPAPELDPPEMAAEGM